MYKSLTLIDQDHINFANEIKHNQLLLDNSNHTQDMISNRAMSYYKHNNKRSKKIELNIF